MKDKNICNKRKLTIILVLLAVLIFFYVLLVLYNFKTLKKYDSVILPNLYVENYDIGEYSYLNAKEKLNFFSEEILGRKIKVKINSKDYEYSLSDLGVSVDEDKTIDEVIKYQNSLAYSKKLMLINNIKQKKFRFIFKIDNSKIQEFLNNVKSNVDIAVVNGYFDTNEGVKYIPGVDGYSMNVDEGVNKIVQELSTGVLDKEIELSGDVVASSSNELYSSIDTMTSSFVTNFNVWEGTRPINLRTALNYINGAIVEPGEVFSYYKYAGPYNKSGYVFYYEFVGNGVCQIATTTYNAALLGGLEIVKRYPHAKKSVYVEGGLDATVASYSSGWHVDFEFKNTYKYPIYIKAYAVGGEAHVEFWSNSNAKEGKTYSTESVQIGARGYTTYLHTYKDGVEIDKSKIATTWYPEE